MSYSLDGGNDWLTTSTPPISGYPFTWSVWVKHTQTGVDDAVIQLGTETSGDYKVSLQITSGNTLGCVAKELADVTCPVPAGTITDTGAWYHLVFVGASTTSRTAYLNGTAGTTSTTSVNPWASGTKNQFVVGVDMLDALDLTGKVAHVAVWNAALSGTDISNLYAGDNPQTVQSANLVAYWPLLADPNDVIGANNFSLGGNAALDGADNPTVDSFGSKGRMLLLGVG